MEDKELIIVKYKRRSRIMSVITGVMAFLTFIFLVYAFVQKGFADECRKLAEQKSVELVNCEREAERQKQNADNAAEQARRAQQMAEKAAEMAQQAAQKALKK